MLSLEQFTAATYKGIVVLVGTCRRDKCRSATKVWVICTVTSRSFTLPVAVGVRSLVMPEGLLSGMASAGCTQVPTPPRGDSSPSRKMAESVKATTCPGAVAPAVDLAAAAVVPPNGAPAAVNVGPSAKEAPY